MSAVIFRVQSADLAGRLDPFYHLPAFAEVERKVLARGGRPMGGMIRAMASGATPKLSRREEFYADAETGAPLLRVQNITEEGVNRRDLVYIQRALHESDLRRSRVLGGDLLVTITGRIGDAAVAPDGFEGNINQHSVVVRTASRAESEYLAVFLNSRVGRTLTMRRAAGGTRPALDYSALRNIPIVEGLPIVEVMRKAHAKRAAKEAEAARILSGVDDYLLGELGIDSPQEDEGVPRVFFRRMRALSGGRLDPAYHLRRFSDIERAIENGAHKTRTVGECVRRVFKGIEVGSKNYADDGIPYARVSDLEGGELRAEGCAKRIRPALYDELRGEFKPRAGEMLYTKDASIGHSAVVETETDCVVSGGILRVAPAAGIEVGYMAAILSAPPLLALAKRESAGAVLLHLRVEDFMRLRIPVPPLATQRKIVARIGKIRARAKRLQAEAAAAMKSAHDEVERIILAD